MLMLLHIHFNEYKRIWGNFNNINGSGVLAKGELITANETTCKRI